MKYHVWMSGVMIALALVLASGCATTGKGMSDEEMIRMQVDAWGQGLVAQDLDKVMAVYSESFSAPQAPDKQALADFLQEAVDSGYLEDAEYSVEDAQFTIEEDACSVYPIDLMSVAGSVSVELKFTKEGCNWLITGMEVDGL